MAGGGARAGLKGCVKPSSLLGRRRGTNRDPSVHVRPGLNRRGPGPTRGAHGWPGLRP